MIILYFKELEKRKGYLWNRSCIAVQRHPLEGLSGIVAGGCGEAPDDISQENCDQCKPTQYKGDAQLDTNALKRHRVDDLRGPAPSEGDAGAHDSQAHRGGTEVEDFGAEGRSKGYKNSSQYQVFDEGHNSDFFHDKFSFEFEIYFDFDIELRESCFV